MEVKQMNAEEEIDNQQHRRLATGNMARGGRQFANAQRITEKKTRANQNNPTNFSGES